MSQRIRILPESLANKIAAGEVVERPASVVKELVENALDAGCREVIVEIESGGRRLIRVADDGCGMSREDALLSLERHATSKIASDADLFNLCSLGFRGEALPSIASVSRFTLATRLRNNIEGTEIYAEGGRIKEVKACGMAEGTVISVRNLFFNTPARLKFMRSVETEMGHVGDLMVKLAISRPEIRFTYAHNGKTLFRTSNSDLRERVAALLGRSLVNELHAVSGGDGHMAINGFVGSPDCTRSSSSHLFTYINGRFIRDKVVQHAILQAYRGLLERGRYPVVVLFISVPADDVDVNVHPTKHEVRFREQSRVHDVIVTALEKVLRETPWLSCRPTNSSSIPRQSGSQVSRQKVAEVRDLLENYRPAPSLQPVFLPKADIPPKPCPASIAQFPPTITTDQAGYFSSLTVIGQYQGAYILCQDGADLVIIDQHAAHERTAFERLRREFAASAIESQSLLFPQTIEFTFKEAAALRDNLEQVCRLGFSLEEFGGTTWLLHAVPGLLKDRDYVRALRDVLEDLESLGNSSSFEIILEAILAKIACHGVIRGISPLSSVEIRALFAQMDASGFSSNCPHGRPVSRKLTIAEIEKMFKR